MNSYVDIIPDNTICMSFHFISIRHVSQQRNPQMQLIPALDGSYRVPRHLTRIDARNFLMQLWNGVETIWCIQCSNYLHLRFRYCWCNNRTYLHNLMSLNIENILALSTGNRGITSVNETINSACLIMCYYIYICSVMEQNI